jgi:Fic family protein
MSDTDTHIDQRLFERIRRKKLLLDDRRPLPEDAVKRLREELRLHHTYNSDAIEGNSLTLQETRLVISDGITVGGKSLIEHLEAKGNAEGFDLILSLAAGGEDGDGEGEGEEGGRDWNHVLIQEIHEVVTRGQIADSGKYRTENVRIAGAVKTPPSYSKVVSLLDDYLETIRSMDAADALNEGDSRKTHPLVVAGYIHHTFVAIHPFIDGNGRVARLLTNLYLISMGYPPIVLKVENRMAYYDALRRGDLGDLTPLVKFIAQAINDSLTLFLSIFGEEDELIPLKELADHAPYTQEYLSLRARQGVLDAMKIGKVWHSTRKALEEYMRSHMR